MGREVEVKLRAESREILQMVEQDPLVQMAKKGDARDIAMETVYYDTKGNDLSARRWTLRLRRENGSPVVTVKTPAPGRGRGEWETSCETIEEAVPQLLELGAPKELKKLVAEGVFPRCSASFHRKAIDLTLPDGTWAELALDQGKLTGGSREEAFAEVELELKTGSEEAVDTFAQGLALRYGLTAQPRSKFARAAALAEEK